jgi:hypothetical protein
MKELTIELKEVHERKDPLVQGRALLLFNGKEFHMWEGDKLTLGFKKKKRRT